MLTFDELLAEVGQRAERVRGYLLDEQYRPEFAHPHLQDAIYSYVRAGGKALRPAVLMFCCGAVGGMTVRDSGAAAVELYHTWTLVHDDIIDRDDFATRRPTGSMPNFGSAPAMNSALMRRAPRITGLSIAILAAIFSRDGVRRCSPT